MECGEPGVARWRHDVVNGYCCRGKVKPETQLVAELLHYAGTSLVLFMMRSRWACVFYAGKEYHIANILQDNDIRLLSEHDFRMLMLFTV